jgi:hypothetical protein
MTRSGRVTLLDYTLHYFDGPARSRADTGWDSHDTALAASGSRLVLEVPRLRLPSCGGLGVSLTQGLVTACNRRQSLHFPFFDFLPRLSTLFRFTPSSSTALRGRHMDLAALKPTVHIPRHAPQLTQLRVHSPSQFFPHSFTSFALNELWMTGATDLVVLTAYYTHTPDLSSDGRTQPPVREPLNFD